MSLSDDRKNIIRAVRYNKGFVGEGLQGQLNGKKEKGGTELKEERVRCPPK